MDKSAKKLGTKLPDNVKLLKDILPAEDVLVYTFRTADGKSCAAVYTDGITDKESLGELAAKPLTLAKAPKSREEAKKLLYFPEMKDADDAESAASEILAGNPALLIDGIAGAVVLGTKKIAVRAVTEPQTAITVKGPREGFIEDIKTNMGLVRRRIKSPALRLDTQEVGKYSKTVVSVVYLEGITDARIVEEIKERIAAVEIDGVPDSSYIAQFLAKKPYSLFKQVGTTEKPDVFCAKLLEGRAGVLVDGSPIALTLPYMLSEDFQSAQDYFVSPYRATITRLLRLAAVCIALFLPAFYVAAQLFKLQLLPFALLMTISGGIQGIPLSPSLELFFLLVVLEILIEASVRMPKYVALALSVIGALVLGDTAVKAGIISTPAIIIVAFSAICLYTVPDLVETTTTLRWIFLIISGSIGTFGIVLFAAFLLCYLVTEQAYGVPLTAPFSPLVAHDMSDGLLKRDMYALSERPKVLRSKNKVRLKRKNKQK